MMLDPVHDNRFGEKNESPPQIFQPKKQLRPTPRRLAKRLADAKGLKKQRAARTFRARLLPECCFTKPIS
jgi:hypothetical protein